MERMNAVITRVVRETNDTVTLYFVVPDHDFTYTAGQYITVFFDGTSTPQGKAYSLSSAPYEKELSITVKKVGEYSGRIHALQPGDAMQISEAYGFFNPLTSDPLVCLSAGCGLAPVWSVVKQELQQDKGRRATIHFSNKTDASIVMKRELDECEKKHRNIHVQHHITRQESVPNTMKKGRINLDECVNGASKSAVYLLCGSVDFVRDMWQGLTARGVDSAMISTETFFE